MRYRTLLFTTPALATLLSLSACGSEQAADSPRDTASGTTTVQPTRSPADQLTVEVRASAKATPKTWTLTCDPAGGDHPEAAKACAALSKAQDPFKPISPQQICTEIYGGPQEAKVKGTWRGRQVDTGFTRKNGCELHRWDQVAPLFGDTPKAN
ncbi:SSI family serine proteinase inhibitor [Actinomadura miaoliensis]|uniref:SSI family serine proteinase inhibitor n=1 Tax=Actinomadura miaoliensis TaxID=430685 RepID=A0ABP7V7P8_9ACTN